MPDSIPKILIWIAVTLLALFLVHLLTEDREKVAAKKARKNNLLQSLRTWEHEIQYGLGKHHEVARTFRERKSELIRLSSVSTGDYPARFSANVKAITDMTDGEVDREEKNNDQWDFIGAKKLLGLVQSLIVFVEKH